MLPEVEKHNSGKNLLIPFQNDTDWNTFSLQLCVNVQIPESLFGLEGAAVFIDTNRGFTVNRLKGRMY